MNQGRIRQDENHDHPHNISTPVAQSRHKTSNELMGDLIRLIREPDVEVQDICQLVKRIPGLAGAIVRRANSSEFSLKHPVERIEHAVMVLGFRRTQETVEKRRDAAHATIPTPHLQNQGNGILPFVPPAGSKT